MLPFLPKSQNSLLFPNSREPKTPPEYIRPSLTKEIESFGLPVNQSYQETRTRIPYLPLGPLGTATQKLEERWNWATQGLKEISSMAPVSPPEPIVREGWTRYPHNPLEAPSPVPYPQERVILYDTETIVRKGGHPIIGVAASTEAWYVWLSPSLVHGNEEVLGDLIPLGPGKLGIAHFAPFDSSKTQESYNLNNSDRPVFLDTMSLHNTMSGMGGSQVKNVYRALPRNNRIPWAQVVCNDDLASVLKFYTGRTISKEARNLFVTGSLKEIRESLAEQLTYALNDVYELWWLFLAIYPRFRKHCPSIITLAGVLELSRSLLPITQDFRERVLGNSVTYEALSNQISSSLEDKVKELTGSFLSGELDPSEDLWLAQLDWTPAKSGKNKGVPKWVRDLKGKVTMGKNCAPLLLRVTYEDCPLFFDKTKKWGYFKGDQFHKLPHPKGPKENVGSPFVKDFISLWESGVLKSEGDPELAKKLSNLSYWQSYQSRFEETYIKPNISEDRDGIVPLTTGLGTLTGRQVNKTWLTAAQCKKEKLGTDLFHAIQPPEGWDLVLWDEDTEEVRIAAIWGDFKRGYGLGSTPMTQYALLGDKSLGTDAHTITAKVAGVSRSEGKIANFRDLFGGGEKTQSQAIKSAHPDWEEERVRETVEKIMKVKRGDRLSGKYQGGTDSEFHNMANMVARTQDFRLPMTQRQLPDAVNCRYDTKNQFFTSRYNFPVQGTGSDILHATAALVPLVAEEEGIKELGYIMARHDEIAYMTPSENSDTLAEVGNTVHCWAWAMFLESLGFNWMPTPLCRLSAINIDKVYRKEVDMGIDAGYNLGWTFEPGREIN